MARSKQQRGNTFIEFAVVMGFLLPMFAAAYTLGMTLSKGIQVGNVCRDAAVLMVRSNTDPNANLDLSQTQNQRMLIRAAAGLRMNSDAANDPDPNGMGTVILSRVVYVGNNECSAGVIPAPGGAPPWNAGNCPNYNQYVFGYRIVIGNASKFSSRIGNPPSVIIQSNGTISAADIAKNTSNRALNFGNGGVVTLQPGTFALVSEMYADVSWINVFSILQTPVIYARSVT